MRSRPPFTGVLLGPGPESVPRSAFWAILGTCPKLPPAQKALRGALSGPGPKSTPVNGGRDRKVGPKKHVLGVRMTGQRRANGAQFRSTSTSSTGTLSTSTSTSTSTVSSGSLSTSTSHSQKAQQTCYMLNLGVCFAQS